MQRDADRLRASASADSGEALQKLDELMRMRRRAAAAQCGGHPRQPASIAWQAEPVPADAPWWQRVAAAWCAARRARWCASAASTGPKPCCWRPTRPSSCARTSSSSCSMRAWRCCRGRPRRRAANWPPSPPRSTAISTRPRAATQAAATLLQQLQAQIKTGEPPRIDDTLAALATAAAGR